MKDYTPGQGSYKVEEAGSLTGVGTTGNVDNNFGTLTFQNPIVNIAARGLPISLDAHFSSDHLYSCGVISAIAKYEKPESTLMTVPESHSGFYRIADGWSWRLPWVDIGDWDVFRVVIGGRSFDLQNVLTQETWQTERWTEGYHVIQTALSGTQASAIIVIPEILATITCTIEQHSSNGFRVLKSGFALYQADGSKLEFYDSGYLRTMTDSAGKNTLTFTYESIGGESEGSFTSSVVGTPTRKVIGIQTSDYALVDVGDLITIDNDTRVIFSKDDIAETVTVSGAFDVLPSGSDSYTIHKGRIQRIEHSDDRHVKFYYYAAGTQSRIAILLSSKLNMTDFGAGDQFLARLSIDESNRLLSYETVDTLRTTDQIPGFNTGIEADDSQYLAPIQAVTYAYSLTSEPNTTTDFVRVTNPAGGTVTYRFAMGGFATHNYNTKNFHTGVVRRGSGTQELLIERPDFPIQVNDWINISRINQEAFEDVLKHYELRDEEREEFNVDRNELAESLENFDRWSARWPSIFQKGRDLARERLIERFAKPVSEWVQVTEIEKAGRIKVGVLAKRPKQNDIYVLFSGSATSGRYTTRSSDDPGRIFVDHDSFDDGDYILMRNEVREISGRGQKSFDDPDGVSVSHDYVDLERDFSFAPLQNEEVLFVTAAEMGNPQFSAYYLNKPKVVRVDEKRTDTDSEWKVRRYSYSYFAAGKPRVDDEYTSGFTFADVHGPVDQYGFAPDNIELQNTSITTALQRLTGDSEEFTQKNIFFAYDQKGFLMGTSREGLLRKDGNNWVFVEGTRYQLGRPCANGSHFGVIGFSRLKGSVPTIGEFRPPASGDKYAEFYGFDLWGRKAMVRKSSPSYEGRPVYTSYLQYAIHCDSDDADPYGKFTQNQFAAGYLHILNDEKKYALDRVAATIDEVGTDGTVLEVHREFDLDDVTAEDSTLNLITERVYEATSIPSEAIPVPAADFRGVPSTGSPVLYSDDVATPPVDHIRWTLPGLTPSDPEVTSEQFYNWESARFGTLDFITTDRILDTEFVYDTITNNLTTIRRPEGNTVNLEYGAGVKSSLVIKDYQELDANLGGTKQYIVTSYDYDLKGRLIERVVRLKTDVDADDDNRYNPTTHPNLVTKYQYDGQDRLLRTIGLDGSAGDITLRRAEYQDELRRITLTDSLGMRTRTEYDEFYRTISVQRIKPSTDTGAEFDALNVEEVIIGETTTEIDPLSGKPSKTITFTEATSGSDKQVVTRFTRDSLRRQIAVHQRTTDSAYNGDDDTWALVSETEYNDPENSVRTRTYRTSGEGASFVQVEVENDWLGRGALRRHTWTGGNGGGEKRTTSFHYDVNGNLLRQVMPNGEAYEYVFNNRSMIEEVVNPDGSTSRTKYDMNGNIARTVDRNGVALDIAYNTADMPVAVATNSMTKRFRYALHTTQYSHAGPAVVSTFEDAATDPPTTEIVKTTYDYDRFGNVTGRRQEAVADSVEMSVGYAYDDAGNLTSTTVTSGPVGSANWTKSVFVQQRYISGSNATEPYLERALLPSISGPPLITERVNFAGLPESLTYASTAERVLSRTYDRFLRLSRILSNEGGAKSLDFNLERDQVGNITRRFEPISSPTVDHAYTYDGMDRLLSGEGEEYRFDELSNIVAKGADNYSYERSGVGHQMRVASFTSGGTTHEYTYDAPGTSQIGQGNPIEITNRFPSLEYDEFNRLRELTRTDSSEDHYWYTPRGLRFKKAEDVNRDNGATKITYTMYEGNEILCQDEYEDNGTSVSLVESRFNLISPNPLLPAILGQYRRVYPSTDELRFFANDHLGSCRVVYSDAGTVTDNFSYSAYGEKTHTVQTNEFLAHYTGKQYDGSGLVYFNARYYDPETGRFLTADPARDGGNWYQYAGGNPVRRVDRSGLASVEFTADDNGGGSTVQELTDEEKEAVDDNRRRAGEPAVEYPEGDIPAPKPPVLFDPRSPLWLPGTNDVIDIFSFPDFAAAADQHGIDFHWFPGHTEIDQAIDHLAEGEILKGVGLWLAGAVDQFLFIGKAFYAAKTLGFGVAGREITIGSNFRLAPFGNRTGHPQGKFPHYHRRRIGPNGKPLEGQGLPRHRPWQKMGPDTSFWDRF